MMSERIYLLLCEDAPESTATHHPDRTVTDAETGELQAEERTTGYKLTAKQVTQREKLVGTLLEYGKRFLELRDKTVELTIRLLDYYCMRLLEGVTWDGKRVGHAEKGRWALERKEQGMLVAVACLFCCAKYNEIYPPALSDIIFIFCDRLVKADVIRCEHEVLQVTEFAFEISTISKWYEHYFTCPLPVWANDCYLKCYGRMEAVARVIRELAAVESEGNIAARVGMAQRVVAMLNLKDCRTDRNNK